MKIEIGENLIYCYLKHVEGCRVVQTNWKTSSKWTVTEYDDANARRLFEKISNSEIFRDIFKNNSFDQLIKQAEIDVLGLNTVEKSVFGVDVAFHSLGLQYVDSQETANRVLKKIFRTIFVMQSYFSDFDKFNSFFVTPKVQPATRKLINPLIIEARNLINDESINIDFISNEEFYSNYIDPMTGDLLEDNDTMELFSRAVKLIQLDPRVKTHKIPTIKTMSNLELVSKSNAVTDKRTVDGMKIGQYVVYQMRKLYESNLISKDEIQKLQDKGYCKSVFNIDFEMLRSKNKEIVENGIKRYYAKEYYCGNYYLTSQWYERHWEPFLSWVRKIKK